jgi:hypothetical protein
MDDQAPVLHVRMPITVLESARQALGLEQGSTRAAVTRAAFAYITGLPTPAPQMGRPPRKPVASSET